MRIITKTYKRGSFKISQDDMYTYVKYSPIERSTITSSCMYPHDSNEALEIVNGDLIVSVDAKGYFEDRGFVKVDSVIYIEKSNQYKVTCEAIYPEYATPQILRIDTSWKDIDAVEPCVCAYVKLLNFKN